MNFYPHTPEDFKGIEKISLLPMVYALATPSLEFVKIGYTKSPKNRFSNIQNGCPLKLSLWLAIRTPIPNELEDYIHSALFDYRSQGEWFALPNNKLDWLLDFFGKTNLHIQEVHNALV